MIGFLRLIRWPNLLIVILTQILTRNCLVIDTSLHPYDFCLLVLSTVLIAAAGYIINDYYDVKIDLINKPERVVIGKGITRRFAILFHTLLTASGVMIGFFIGWKVGGINLFCATWLWWYSNSLKRQPFIGNFSVALLTGLSLFIINVLYEVNHLEVVIYALFAFFMTLIREVIKDMEDLKGDNTFGCKTLPIIWGLRRTKFFIYAVLAIFVIMVVMINQQYVMLPIYYFIIFLFAPLLWLLVRLIRADTVKDFYRLSQFCKVIMLLGILSMPFVNFF